MPKQKYEYSVSYPGKDRDLTKREIIFLRKLCRTSGRRLVNEIAQDPNHKFRSFFLDVWYNYNHGERRSGVQSQECLEAMCEVQPGLFSTWYLEQGDQQKKTYRTNRFEENIRHATSTMSRGRFGAPMLWRVDTDLNQKGSGYESRIRDVNSYVVANNHDEASTVWQTMVLNPLAIEPQRGVTVRFIGPSSHFSCLTLNNEALDATKSEIQKKREELEKTLEELKKTQERSEFAFALINQTLAMVGLSEDAQA